MFCAGDAIYEVEDADSPASNGRSASPMVTDESIFHPRRSPLDILRDLDAELAAKPPSAAIPPTPAPSDVSPDVRLGRALYVARMLSRP
jgi:hypothetical protein